MLKNEVLEVTLDELRLHGVEATVAYATKHVQVRWLNRLGEPRFTSLSRSPSTERHALQNARREVRIKLREDGMLTETKIETSPFRPLSRLDKIEARLTRIEQLLKGYENGLNSRLRNNGEDHSADETKSAD